MGGNTLTDSQKEVERLAAALAAERLKTAKLEQEAEIIQAQVRAEVELQAMEERHRKECEALEAHQIERTEREEKELGARYRSGFMGWVDKVSGWNEVVAVQNELEGRSHYLLDCLEQDAQKAGQAEERFGLEMHIERLKSHREALEERYAAEIAEKRDTQELSPSGRAWAR